ncbi:MAG: hypothetical protein HY052_07885 [Proteobacteria bacterium]|nr:hypothetical protein [Pseudomonadota bacterium]
MTRIFMGTVCMTVLLSLSAPAWAEDTASELQSLKAEIAKMQERINQLEQAQQQAAVAASAAPVSGAQSNDNAFNPAISAVLNGHFSAFSNKNPTVAGFGTGDDGKHGSQGLSLDESELGISSNVDDKFAAQITASLSEAGASVEEAYVKSLGLPGGLGFKAGRFLQPVGYLNEHHGHTDDFADRPLPSRIFLNNEYKDDGVGMSWILPTNTYAEIGGSALRGDDFPAGNVDQAHSGAWAAYSKIGGDIGANQNWLLGFSTLQASPSLRKGNDDTVKFIGDSDLYLASVRYIWDPTGNSLEKELTLQGEYFWRKEDGTYEDTGAVTGAVPFNGGQTGWYAQGVYKFLPQWRVGARYSQLNPDNVPAGLVASALDAHEHNPWNAALMTDWTNSEFSRVRLQYGHENPAAGKQDDQIILQYIMAIGAHPAHTF